ncbi:MAG: endosialidase [Agathobacter sp.]|nr:endosialidase [Agathobacter sp.]
MAEIRELIQVESDGTISFGDYTLSAKAKLDNFNVDGKIYKVKTYKDITKLECNDVFVYESVPGTAVTNFTIQENQVSFTVNGVAGAQITLGLEPETEYEIFVGGESVGVMNTNLGGKLSLSVEITETDGVSILVNKK